MKYLPLIFTIILICLLGGGIGYFVMNMAKNDSSIVQSSVRTTESEENLSFHNIDVLHSNQWYSNIYKDFPTNPIYAFPLAFKINEEGLGFSYPQPDFKEKTVFAVYNEDFVIGFSDKISKPQFNSIGDWSINFRMENANNDRMDVFIGQGFPFASVKVFQGDVTLRSNKKLEYYQDGKVDAENKNDSTNHLIIKVDSKYYALYFDKNLNLNYTSNSVTIKSPNTIFVAILDKPQSFGLFEKHRNDLPANTTAQYAITNESLLTSFEIQNESKESLIALMPHQYDLLSKNYTSIGEYNTLRGKMKLYELSKFETSVQLALPPQNFEENNNNMGVIQEQIKKDINGFINGTTPDSKNYFLGTWLGMASNLILLADTYELQNEKAILINHLKPIFEESLEHYYYDNEKKSLIAKRPEFGNDELNDHHFHYSYYIRLGAILKNNNLELTDNSLNIIGEMVKDIANYDRQSDRYPYVRNFDIFESHSWADGFADAADGNNQESTSEAINSWYSVYLWGKATGDKELENLGLALYNSEINSALYYWFDITGIYQEPYQHKIASIVWGGKVDFATWFSSESNMIYGIQLLPFTPASTYLAKVTNFEEYENDLRKSGGGETKEWWDLFLMFKSYHKEVDLSEIPEDIKGYDRIPRSLLMHIISINQKDE